MKNQRPFILPLMKGLMEYIVVFTIILSNSIWNTKIGSPITYGKLLFTFSIAMLLLFVICIFENRSTWIDNESLIKIGVMIIILVLSTVAQKEGRADYILFFCLPMVAASLFFAMNRDPETFWKRYMNVMACVCLIALFFYVTGTVLKMIPPNGKVAYKWEMEYTADSWYHVYYEAYYGEDSVFAFLPRKNTGLYTEAPMFMVYICLAIAGELAFCRKPRKSLIAITVLTVCTTMSATGLIFLALIFFIWFYRTKFIQERKILKYLVIPLFICLALVAVIWIYNRKASVSTETASIAIRMDHMLTAFRLWLRSPLFGLGVGTSDLLIKESGYNQGMSVGLPVFLAESGILVFSIYGYAFISSIVKSLRENKNLLYFSLGTFVLLFLTAVSYTPIMTCIICCLLTGQHRQEPQARIREILRRRLPSRRAMTV